MSNGLRGAGAEGRGALRLRAGAGAGAGAGEAHKLGARVRGLRRKENLSQVQLAERLGISPSYLNLIENNKRPLPAALLLRLAQQFEFDLQSFAGDDDARLVSDLMECFADPLFEAHPLTNADVREFATTNPAVGRAVLALYRAFTSAREGADALAHRLSAGDPYTGVERVGSPSEEVGDLLQRHMNHFEELEEGAEKLWRDAKLDRDELYGGLARYLERARGVAVKVARWGDEKGTLRRFDGERKTLVLSELLPTRSRVFQIAHQIALLSHHDVIERLLEGADELSTDESRALARVALANYFAGAVLMPYRPFLTAAREERYDIDVLGRRFRVGFEQVCHRLTTMRRPGAEGVPFHFIRIDVAGNISKRFSASGIRFARYSGACPRWNMFSAFSTPGMIRIQLSRMPDGSAFFCIARTIQKDAGGFHAQHPVMAIGLGCQLQFAHELVYSDGVDLKADLAVPVGVTCRTCERTDCEQRALPSLKVPLRIDENTRGFSLYASRG